MFISLLFQWVDSPTVSYKTIKDGMKDYKETVFTEVLHDKSEAVWQEMHEFDNRKVWQREMFAKGHRNRQSLALKFGRVVWFIAFLIKPARKQDTYERSLKIARCDLSCHAVCWALSTAASPPPPHVPSPPPPHKPNPCTLYTSILSVCTTIKMKLAAVARFSRVSRTTRWTISRYVKVAPTNVRIDVCARAPERVCVFVCARVCVFVFN